MFSPTFSENISRFFRKKFQYFSLSSTSGGPLPPSPPAAPACCSGV
jgi:hypothetical protein